MTRNYESYYDKIRESGIGSSETAVLETELERLQRDYEEKSGVIRIRLKTI